MFSKMLKNTRRLSVQERKPEKKRGFFGRMFGKGSRHREHESFSGFAQTAPSAKEQDENSGANIVILNSLTHNQLMELLKVRCMTLSVYGMQWFLWAYRDCWHWERAGWEHLHKQCDPRLPSKAAGGKCWKSAPFVRQLLTWVVLHHADDLECI